MTRASRRHPRQRVQGKFYAPVLLTVVAGLLVSIAGFIAAGRHERRAIESEFTMASADRVSALRRDIQTDLFFLESLGAFYKGSEKVTRAEFRQFVEYFLALPQHGAIQALEWAPRVSQLRRARYEEELREEGREGFRITERKRDGTTVSAGDREEYFPVSFIEPYEGNESTVGFDLGSDEGVLEALRRARDTGQMAATGRIVLAQKSAARTGVLACLAVYRPGAALGSVEDRRANLEGFVVGVFRVGDMMETALAYLEPRDIDIFLYDDSLLRGDRFLYLRLAGGGEGAGDASSGKRREGPYGALTYSAAIDVGGRQWLVACTSTPAHFAAGKTWQPWTVMIAGVLSTGLLAAYIFTLLRGMVRARTFAAKMLDAKRVLEHEVAERKRASEAILAAKQEWERTFDAVPDLIAIIDDQHRIRRVNQAMANRLGKTPQQCIGLVCYQAIHGLDHPPDFCPHVLTCTDGKEHTADVHEDNLGGDFVVTTTPMVDPQGQFAWSVHVARDITERKRGEQALRESEERYRSVTENIGVGVALIAPDMRILSLNKQMREWFPRADVSKTPVCYRAFNNPPREAACSYCPTVKTLRDGRVHEAVTETPAGDRVINFRVVSSPIKDESGRIVAAIEMVEDITRQKQAEEVVSRARRQAEEKAAELQKVNKQLTRAVAEKDDFLRAVSHDLSAPLRNIGGMAAFLQSQYADRLDATGRDRLDRILNNVAVQNGLIQDLLELSQIKTRRGKLQQTDLGAMVRALADQFAFDLEKKSGRIQLSGEFPVLWCETNRIRQVFQNLMDNAIKYAHPDRPLQIAVIGQRDDHGYRFTVADNGIGMCKEDTDAVFFVFRRIRNAYTAKIEGKGVGLATVKTIVENHGGEIWVESQEGFGSSFVFTLPASAAAPPETESEPESLSAG